MIDIQKFIDDYKSWQEEERQARRKKTNEVFTPYSIVEKMCNKVPEEDWRDPNKTFLEPCCGSGNFILVIIFHRINSGIDWQTTLQTLYALDLLETNVKESRQRVHELLQNIAPDYSRSIADEIMDKNFIVHDFFTWNFEEWRPYTDEELKKLKIKKLAIIFEVIQDYIQHQIQQRRKRIDFITENYNLIHHRAKRDEMSQYITEIQELNELLDSLYKIINRIIELSGSKSTNDLH